MNSLKAIVVGSGIAGLSSAIRLVNKGYQVKVFEANNYPGGKLTQIDLNGFRFDAGPSLFTMPQLVDELFELSGKDVKDYFSYSKCALSCKYFFDDGVNINFYQDKVRLKKEIKDKLKVDTKPFENHLKLSSYIYQKTSGIFMEKSLHKVENYFSLSTLKGILAIPKLRLFKSLHKTNLAGLNHPKLVQIFDRYATYNGSDPYKAPGVLNIIPHIEHDIGTFLPDKGMHSITSSLVQLSKDLGVEFLFNQKVDEILVKDNKVKGVRVKNIDYLADIVVCNSDIKPAYKNLLIDLKKPLKTLNQEPSSSALIFYWGISKEFNQLDLHNIFFSKDYKKEFNEIFNESNVTDDPTVYVNITSKYLKDDAPKGMQNWFVMINTPYNSGQNWDEIRKRSRANIIRKLNKLLGDGIEKYIIEEDYLDPVRIEEKTSSFGGALYGASSNDRMAAFLRHPNFLKVKGLYFSGGSVHPGGGIPLCLLSSKIVDSLIKKA